MVSRLFHWMKHYACNGFYEVCSKQTCLCRTLGGKVITTMMKKYTRELRPQKTEKEERKGSVEILQNSIISNKDIHYFKHEIKCSSIL